MIEKYYVSTKDGAYNGGIKRLTPYYADRETAEKYYIAHREYYGTLLLRKLINNRKRVTLRSL